MTRGRKICIGIGAAVILHAACLVIAAWLLWGFMGLGLSCMLGVGNVAWGAVLIASGFIDGDDVFPERRNDHG